MAVCICMYVRVCVVFIVVVATDATDAFSLFQCARDARDPHSGPHACVANSLPTEASPHPLPLFLCI